MAAGVSVRLGTLGVLKSMSDRNAHTWVGERGATSVVREVAQVICQTSCQYSL